MVWEDRGFWREFGWHRDGVDIMLMFKEGSPCLILLLSPGPRLVSITDFCCWYFVFRFYVLDGRGKVTRSTERTTGRFFCE